MSAIEKILARMIQDPVFAEAVLSDAKGTLAEYGLPADELNKFKALTRTELAAIVIEERKSFASGGGGGAGKTSGGG